MVIRRFAAVACAALVVAGLALPANAQTHDAAAPASSFSWNVLPTGSTDQFRGLAAVDARVAWVSGESGTVLRTTNGGTNWRDVSPPEAAGLALRDIEAWDGQHAVTLSIGPGKQSNIFSTDDGGVTWTRAFQNRNRSAFYDCMAFSDDGTGLALSDPVNGHFRFAISYDYGHSWTLRVPRYIPRALGEFAFAASGTCLVAGPGHTFWAASGGEHPRIYKTYNAGLTWTARPTPIRSGPSAGIYSIAFHGPALGVAVGGDYADPENRDAAAATSLDGGDTWGLSSRQVGGYRSGVDYVTGKIVVAVGPTGSDVSRDGGRTWTTFDDQWFDGVHVAEDGTAWASGTEGRVAVLQH
jgi:photosystem II stability/assembly factor-like uncharacterized protein